MERKMKNNNIWRKSSLFIIYLSIVMKYKNKQTIILIKLSNKYKIRMMKKQLQNTVYFYNNQEDEYFDRVKSFKEHCFFDEYNIEQIIKEYNPIAEKKLNMLKTESKLNHNINRTISRSV